MVCPATEPPGAVVLVEIVDDPEAETTTVLPAELVVVAATAPEALPMVGTAVPLT